MATTKTTERLIAKFNNKFVWDDGYGHTFTIRKGAKVPVGRDVHEAFLHKDGTLCGDGWTAQPGDFTLFWETVEVTTTRKTKIVPVGA